MAAKQNYGVTVWEQIELAGDDWRPLCVPDFRKVEELSPLLGLVPLPRSMLDWLHRRLAARPRIIAARCIRCGLCRKVCPVDPPVIDPLAVPEKQMDDTRCIQCYCCHEFCPVKALELKKTLLNRLLRRARVID